MSFTITDAFVSQYSANLRFLAQQMTSRLRGTVIEEQLHGEALYMDQMGPTAARKVIARHSDSPLMGTQSLRRRITPYDYDWGDLVDRLDLVRLLIDPTSSYARNGAMALNRAFDDEIIAAFFGTALTGHQGNTACAWPAGNSEAVPTQPGGNVVAVNSWAYGNGAGNTGLTVSKLIEAKMALLTGEGDEDEPSFILVGAKQIGNLLATTEVTSSDFNDLKALKNGVIDTFMGFQFVHSERNTVDANGYSRVAAWRKSGMGLGVAKDIEGQVTIRPDKRMAHYAYADMAIGASRLEEVKVVEIKCA